MEARLKSEIWIKALIRRWQGQFVPVMVCHRGDTDAGSILLKLNRFSTVDGARAWLSATGPEVVDEKAADDYIARQLRYDPDVWVLEVEDTAAVFELDDPVVS